MCGRHRCRPCEMQSLLLSLCNTYSSPFYLSDCLMIEFVQVDVYIDHMNKMSNVCTQYVCMFDHMRTSVHAHTSMCKPLCIHMSANWSSCSILCMCVFRLYVCLFTNTRPCKCKLYCVQLKFMFYNVIGFFYVCILYVCMLVHVRMSFHTHVHVEFHSYMYVCIYSACYKHT